MAALIEKEKPKLMWQLKSKEAPAATALQTATTAVCQMDKYHQCYFNINKDLTLSSSQISMLCEHSTTVVTFV